MSVLDIATNTIKKRFKRFVPVINVHIVSFHIKRIILYNFVINIFS